MKTYIEWYRHLEPESLAAQKTSFEQGLSHEEVASRMLKFGYNKFEEAKRKSAFEILWSQFADLFILVLMLAALIATFLGEPQDALAIMAIVVLNALLGFYQEYRAERAMETLKTLAAPTAKVKRMGQILTVAAHELVPGDIIFLEAGNIVPADLRILKSFQLGVDESLLTGESEPVEKMSQVILGERVPIGEQKNMAFKGTLVTAGRAVGVVVETGSATELGRIAKLLEEEVEVRTPLQNRIADFAKKISVLVIAICT